MCAQHITTYHNTHTRHGAAAWNACRQEKRDRVTGVITALGLDKCKNTLVGGPMRRGVSGGERKRVSVGHELLISPSIIILDEPTSGLDSTSAMNLVQTLRDLARDGRSIVTTIHQPSSRLFQQLDRLMLMSNGRLIYSGLGKEVGEWFANLDCKLPYGWNIADYILDLANGEFQDSKPVLGVMGKERKGKLIEVRLPSRRLVPPHWWLSQGGTRATMLFVSF